MSPLSSLDVDSKPGGGNEVGCLQTLDRYLWPQNQRQPRRCFLERTPEDRDGSPSDFVRNGVGHRFWACPQQPVVGPSSICSRPLSRPDRGGWTNLAPFRYRAKWR